MRRGFSRVLVAVLVAALPAGSAFGIGVSLGAGAYAVDVSAALAQVPTAASAALQALSVPPADAAQVLDGLQAGLADFPSLLPVPLLSAVVEIPFPFGVIDDVRLSAGFMTDGVVRGIASLMGETIPRPLWSQTTAEGTFSADVSVSALSLAVEVQKRLDLVVLGLDLTAGLGFVQGSIAPQVAVPPAYESEVLTALAALHSDGLVWSAAVLEVGLGVELGPPFLRLRVEAEAGLPFLSSSGWWQVRVAGWRGTIGLVIRL